jgi:ribosomal protein S1
MSRYERWQIVTGVVTDVRPFGVFLRLDEGSVGFVDLRGMTETWEDPPERFPEVGERVTGVVINPDRAGQVLLSLRGSDFSRARGPAERS